MLAIAHAGIEPRADDVDERAVGRDPQFDLWMGPQERPNHRRQHEVDRRRRGIDAQPARRHVAQTTHLIQRRADIRHRRSRPCQQQLAGFGQRDAAGGAVHQANAEALFHVTEPLAEAGHGDALLDRRAPEIPGAGDGEESFEIAEIKIRHCSIY
jgi:hypothetical protein